MAPHLTHMGVHDHGFNNVSTYGNLWRLAREGRIEASEWETRFYELALKVSGAVQARRWTRLPDGGFIHSFNGAHSLFVDTIRSLRALALGHVLGQRLMEEQDAERQPARSPARSRARDGAVQRLLRPRPRRLRPARADGAREPVQRRERHLPRPEHAAGLLPVQHVDARPRLGDARVRRAARVPRHAAASETARPRRSCCSRRRSATCDHYIDDVTAADGVPYWDAGAPGLAQLPDWRERPPIPSTTSSRSTVPPPRSRAQGLLRLARILDTARRACPKPIATGRPACASRNAVRRDGPVSQHRPEAPGAAAALGLSLAEPVGPRAAGSDDAARRVEPVGRLPRA